MEGISRKVRRRSIIILSRGAQLRRVSVDTLSGRDKVIIARIRTWAREGIPSRARD